jgi:hypothetical protein
MREKQRNNVQDKSKMAVNVDENKIYHKQTPEMERRRSHSNRKQNTD